MQVDAYLLKLSRYIHLNPVETGDRQKHAISCRPKYLKEYRWSSYSAYLELAAPLAGLEPAPVMALVTWTRRNPIAYQHYIQRGLSKSDDFNFSVFDPCHPSVSPIECRGYRLKLNKTERFRHHDDRRRWIT